MENTKASTIPEEILDSVSEESKIWAEGHGIVMYTKHDLRLTHAPFTLLPSPVPQKLFQQAINLAVPFNYLVEKISSHPTFLLEQLKSVESDDFTKRMLDILRIVRKEGERQSIHLGIHRSDYMMHTTAENSVELKQVEINTIAASFSNLSSYVSEMHRYMLERHSIEGFDAAAIPVNVSKDKIPEALSIAYSLYGNNKAVVLMIVHPNETNTFDQKAIEHTLWLKYKIPLIRRSLAEVHQRGSLDPTSHKLFIDGKEIAITYFRAGYSPDDYPSDNEWSARLTIERSMSIKCPSVAYHLSGTKKIQQVLAKPNILEQLMEDEAMSAAVRSCFMGLYSLSEEEEGSAVKDTIEKAKNASDKYVLKPQREGGGNNLYGKELKAALESLPPLQLSSYILMDRIYPHTVNTYVLREGKRHSIEGVYELGIYSTYIHDTKNNTTHCNEYAGYLLRTKVSSADDGGVAAGVAVLDSPLLM